MGNDWGWEEKRPRWFGLSSQQTDRQTDTHENEVWLPRQRKIRNGGGGVGVGADRNQSNRYQKREYHIISIHRSINHRLIFVQSFYSIVISAIFSLLPRIVPRMRLLGCDLVGWRRVSFWGAWFTFIGALYLLSTLSWKEKKKREMLYHPYLQALLCSSTSSTLCNLWVQNTYLLYQLYPALLTLPPFTSMEFNIWR